jgi:hypothetical protein
MSSPSANPDQAGLDMILISVEEIGWMAKRKAEIVTQLYSAAVETVSAAGYGDEFMLQERLGVGDNFISLLVGEMQATGVLGEFDSTSLRYQLIEPRGFY